MCSSPQSHGQWLLAQINKTILSKPQNGAWVHSCARHCGAELLTIDGDTVPSSAIDKFIAGTKKFWLQEAKYPCRKCCNDGQKDVGNTSSAWWQKAI
eukprot:SAG11_NODE_105_length_16528_cov_4.337635_12_plen_97_part_00